MFIEKVINNNVITAVDESQQEVVLMGKGIGFQAKSGQTIDESRIEKKFVMSSDVEMGKLGDLVSSIPLENFDVCVEIIEYAKGVLENRLSSSIYISLTDHINFALERYKSGFLFENPLLHEVRRFYPREYLIGEFAIGLIQQKMNIVLPIDEASSIAMHFVNAEYNAPMGETMMVTTMMNQVVTMATESIGEVVDETDLNFGRFITHLKFLAYRLLGNVPQKENDEELNQMIQRMYKKEYEISEKIAKFISQNYGRNLAESDKINLTIHVRRIRKEN